MLILDEEINSLEERYSLKFDDESREFIKCMVSRDIQACPGAGKTTSLVAKLGLLSEFMPFSDNSGLLVLTHTNVAVDEIKRKLGGATALLGYPNHIGTFQSFINKFLAIPMLSTLIQRKPERIDSVIFNQKLLLKLKKYYLDKFITMSAEANNYSNIESFLGDLTVTDSKVILNLVGNRKKTLVNKGKPSYRNIKRALEEDVVNQVILDGYLTYEHCYDLALGYLKEYPAVTKVFQQRFKYVFIDEAQDTDDRQFSILENLFGASDVVVQRIGDNNQVIFNFLGASQFGWKVGDDPINIHKKKRLSKKISDVIYNVAISPQELCGSKEVDIKPTIIIFDDDHVEGVIPLFAGLIHEYKLNEIDNVVFKAVGGVSKVSDKGHTLPDYFPNYKKGKAILENDLVDKFKSLGAELLSPRFIMDVSLDIVREYLLVKGVRLDGESFTKSRILTYLRDIDHVQYDNFKTLLLEISRGIFNSKSVDNLFNNLLNVFLGVHGAVLDQNVLSEVLKEIDINVQSKNIDNVYRYSMAGVEFDIPVSTIHKVKGETHVATLVFETFKDGYDLYQLLDLFKGNNIRGFDGKKKLVYVAVSRVTHFLCLAIHRKNIHRKKNNSVTEEDIVQLEMAGFNIIDMAG
jgi:DNA helicase-2/ATP-dependent DNA helicase PcrA